MAPTLRLPVAAAACAAVLMASTMAAAGALPLTCGDVAELPPLPAGVGAGAELLQVDVLIRHGDRTDAGTTPCFPDHGVDTFHCTAAQYQHVTTGTPSPYDRVQRLFRKQYLPGRNVDKGNCGLGQLTTKGVNQQLENGRNLRTAYIGGGEGASVGRLLPQNYSFADQRDFFLRSDDSPRVIMSGQSLFRGMYPSVPQSIARSGSQQIVNWWTMDEQMEDIQPSAGSCPNLNAAYGAALKSSQMTELSKSLAAPLAAQFNAALNTKRYTSANVVGAFDCLNVRICHGMQLPAGITQDIVNSTFTLANKFMTLLFKYNNDAYALGSTAGLLKEVLAKMTGAVDNTPSTPKFNLYAGHDNGPIHPWLVSFGVFDDIWCPYASMIVHEVWRLSSGQAAVRMIYNGRVLTPVGCASPLCTWTEFQSIAQSIIAKGDAVCGSSADVDEAPFMLRMG